MGLEPVQVISITWTRLERIIGLPLGFFLLGIVSDFHIFVRRCIFSLYINANENIWGKQNNDLISIIRAPNLNFSMK